MMKLKYFIDMDDSDTLPSMAKGPLQLIKEEALKSSFLLKLDFQGVNYHSGLVKTGFCALLLVVLALDLGTLIIAPSPIIYNL